MHIGALFLSSEFFYFLVFVTIVSAVLFIFKPLKFKKHSLKLLSHFNAEFKLPLGSINFNYKGFFIRLDRRGVSRGAHGTGSFPILWAYVKPYPKIILGHESSGRYAMGSFLILPPHEIIQLGRSKILLGCEDKNRLTELKSIIIKANLENEFLEVFSNEFSHLTVAAEIHLFKESLFKKKHVIRFTGLPETIYQQPEILENILNRLHRILTTIQVEGE